MEADGILFTKESFSVICRTCLNKSNSLYEIFDISHDNIPFKDLLENYASVKIEETDQLPKNLCEICIIKLCDSYKFKNQCLESAVILEKVLKLEIINSEIKTETIKCKLLEVDDVKATPIQSRNITANSSLAIEKFGNHDFVSIGNVDSMSFTSKEEFVSDLNEYDKQGARSSADKQYSELDNFVNKTKKHKNNFKCAKCFASFSIKSNLQRHIMIHTGRHPYLCDICGKSFLRASSFTEHSLMHTGEKRYMCSSCGKQWSMYNAFKNHVDKQKCLVNPNFQNKETTKSNNFMLQMEYPCRVESLVCTECNRPFSTKMALKMHSRIHTKFKGYLCKTCNKDFKVRTLYMQHMMQHRSYTCMCSDCGKGFYNYSGLYKHRTVHTGIKPHKCSVCQRGFSQISSLNMHMLIHTGEKPFTCLVCNKDFTQPNHLKYHMRLHTGEKPYTCSVCHKSFSVNGSLTVHMRIHTGEMPYICAICEKGFYDSTSLKKHQLKHNVNISQISISETINKVIDS